ncbi:MAG: hypothetical protein NT049_17660 [Planctomycetota bacterium]|nr:hypothetical protein [Planctomycetota bacterium]
MKSVLTASLVAVLAMCLVGNAWAEGGGVKAATPAVTPAAPDADKPIKNVALDKVVADVGVQVAQAEKLLKLADDEMAKPEDKRDLKKIKQLKINAALAYFQAAQKAKGFSVRLKEDERPSFLDQYDKPNREKSVSILLELAEAAQKKKDYREAQSLYQEVLQIDPRNATAEAGLKALAEDMKTAKAGTNGGSGGSTDKTDPKGYQKPYTVNNNYTGLPTKWSKVGTGGW